MVSPVLANIYLHYVLDIWFAGDVKRVFKGDSEIVRYADDFICCFQNKVETVKFFEVLPKRLNKFGLEMSKEKSKILMFGRFAERDRKQKGLGKPNI